MRTLILAIAAAFVLSACAAQRMGGLAEPSLLTSPRSYLETVGLETHTKDDVIRVLGSPDETFTHDGRDRWTYRLSEGGARRRFTYIFEGDTLYDVQYNESGLSGPLDGLTAREAQSD